MEIWSGEEICPWTNDDVDSDVESSEMVFDMWLTYYVDHADKLPSPSSVWLWAAQRLTYTLSPGSVAGYSEVLLQL